MFELDAKTVAKVITALAIAQVHEHNERRAAEYAKASEAFTNAIVAIR